MDRISGSRSTSQAIATPCLLLSPEISAFACLSACLCLSPFGFCLNVCLCPCLCLSLSLSVPVLSLSVVMLCFVVFCLFAFFPSHNQTPSAGTATDHCSGIADRNPRSQKLARSRCTNLVAQCEIPPPYCAIPFRDRFTKRVSHVFFCHFSCGIAQVSLRHHSSESTRASHLKRAC